MEVNVASESKDPASVLNHFKKMTRLRKDNPVLVHGAYQIVQAGQSDIYTYARTLNGVKMLVILNFKSKISTIKLAELTGGYDIAINNYDDFSVKGEVAELKEYQGIVLKLR